MFRILYTPNEESRQNLKRSNSYYDGKPYTVTTKDHFETYDEARRYLETNCYGPHADPLIKMQYRIMAYDDQEIK